MRRSIQVRAEDAVPSDLLGMIDVEDPAQVDPNGVRFQGLLSRLDDLVGDADIDVDALIEDDPA